MAGNASERSKTRADPIPVATMPASGRAASTIGAGLGLCAWTGAMNGAEWEGIVALDRVRVFGVLELQPRSATPFYLAEATLRGQKASPASPRSLALLRWD